jgi:hypothetical protein
VSRLDNNLVENALRPSCIGKKNWLFIGHPDAGQRSAILYSLIVSCQRHGKDPLAYLRDLLTRLPRLTNQDDLAPPTPARWQPSGARQRCLIGHHCDIAMMTIAAAPASSAMPHP